MGSDRQRSDDIGPVVLVVDHHVLTDVELDLLGMTVDASPAAMRAPVPAGMVKVWVESGPPEEHQRQDRRDDHDPDRRSTTSPIWRFDPGSG